MLLVVNVGSLDKRSNQLKFSSVGEWLLVVVFSEKTPMWSLMK